MTDIVRTAGRPMSRQLQAALDNLTGRRREFAIVALREGGPVLGEIMDAVALELRLAQLREDHTLAGFHPDADADDPPWPAAEGEPWFPEGG